MLFSELMTVQDGLSNLDVCYGEYLMVYVVYGESIVFTIPVNSYSCTRPAPEVVKVGNTIGTHFQDLKKVNDCLVSDSFCNNQNRYWAGETVTFLINVFVISFSEP